MSPTREPMTRMIRSVLPTALRISSMLAIASQFALVGCRDESNAGPMQYGTESHFLMSCQRDADCGELNCVAGFCSLPCSGDSECEQIGVGSTCGAPSTVDAERSCVVECSGDGECNSWGKTCIGGYCGGHGSSDGPASPSAPNTNDTDDTTDEPATDDAETDPAEAGRVDVAPAASTDAGEPRPSTPEAGTGTSVAPTAPISEAGVPDASAPDASSNGPVDPQAPQSCRTALDCVLATRIDECCPGCQGAFSATYVAAEECVYAEGEATPTGCEPVACPDGCPGAACGEVVGAVCAAGTCALQATTRSCGSCASGEICTFDPNSGLYACTPETCEYDRCHPDRCDQIGEGCCDPLPGDGAMYCNGGLACGQSGCEVPAAAAPERVCGTLLCPEGEVCCDKCEELCVSELSGANCPDDSNPDRVCGE